MKYKFEHKFEPNVKTILFIICYPILWLGTTIYNFLDDKVFYYQYCYKNKKYYNILKRSGVKHLKDFPIYVYSDRFISYYRDSDVEGGHFYDMKYCNIIDLTEEESINVSSSCGCGEFEINLIKLLQSKQIGYERNEKLNEILK